MFDAQSLVDLSKKGQRQIVVAVRLATALAEKERSSVTMRPLLSAGYRNWFSRSFAEASKTFSRFMPFGSASSTKTVSQPLRR